MKPEMPVQSARGLNKNHKFEPIIFPSLRSQFNTQKQGLRHDPCYLTARAIFQLNLHTCISNKPSLATCELES